MKLLVVFLLLWLPSLAKDLNKKIGDTKKVLHSNISKENQIKASLSELSKKMQTYQTTINKVKIKINFLESDIEKYRSKSTISKQKLKKINTTYANLKNSQSSVNKKLVDLLSKQIYLSIFLSQDSSNSKDKIVQNYVNETYSKILRDQFNKTKLKYFKLKLDIAMINTELSKINQKIKTLKAKETKLRQYRKAQQEGAKKLNKLKSSYLKKLTQIRRENSELTKLLRKLNILKQKEEDKKRQTIVLKPSTDGNDLNVRRIGNSYSIAPVAKYRGPKTIAPFKNYKVVRKFGNYTDPAYHIKMFNPNVVLKPIGSKNVINVLDGKVISITKNPSTGNIVIVEHPNGLHTLYAKIDTIADTIKIGRHIKKGYIIGKANHKLFFEVTKNGKNINPLRLIRWK